MGKLFCQSCAMPMDKPELFGMNADETQNNEYCVYCYQNGEYTNPNITMDEMLGIGLKGIDENPDLGGAMKWMIKKMYPGQLKRCKRWS